MTKNHGFKIETCQFLRLQFWNGDFFVIFFSSKNNCFESSTPPRVFPAIFLWLCGYCFFFFRFFRGKLNSRNVYIWQHFHPKSPPKCVHMAAFWPQKKPKCVYMAAFWTPNTPFPQNVYIWHHFDPQKPRIFSPAAGCVKNVYVIYMAPFWAHKKTKLFSPAAVQKIQGSLKTFPPAAGQN